MIKESSIYMEHRISVKYFLFSEKVSHIKIIMESNKYEDSAGYYT